MPNIYRGETKIELGDRTYLLRPSFNAICRIENVTGQGIISLARKFNEGLISLAEISEIITGCIIQVPGGINPDSKEIGTLIMGNGVNYCIPALADLFTSILGGIHEDQNSSQN